MSVRIRLTRTGRKNDPSWRIAVFDSRTRRDGRYLENLGTYDPCEAKPEAKVKLNSERYDHWLKNGALPSDALARLLKHCGKTPNAK
jgi:small subunit ribosomal protein S16